MNYYFFGTLLPEIKIGEVPEIGHREFMALAYDNLSARDYAKTKIVRHFIDIPNLLAYWKSEPLDPMGSLDASGLEEALVTRSGLPGYVFRFLDKYESKEERLRHFPELLATFFHDEIAKTSGALREYLILERDLKLVLTAFRAKQLGRNIYEELRYENPQEEMVAQILAQKDAPQYEPPEKYAEIKDLLWQHADNPLELHKALLEYRFKKLEENLALDYFSIERILSYEIELIMAERWLMLNKEKGKEIVDTLLKEAL